MAWKPIADRLKDLPIVLAGPILRRVEKDNVSVWLALKEPCLQKEGKGLTLEVYDSGTGTGLGSIVMKGGRDTVSLGEHLHIVVLTAKASGTLLRQGVTYSYNVMGNGVDFTGMEAICYTSAGFRLPTFSLPPANLSELRILHASCRKLHAQGTDALADIDGILVNAAAVPATLATTRPHQLFLTGDQVYADDVDPVLLFLIRDLCEGADAKLDVDALSPRPPAKNLLNWTEKLRVGTRYSQSTHPHLVPEHPLVLKGEYKDALEVGRRSELLKKESGLHFPAEWEVVNNHLIKLGEYYAMYLLMWSPVLWPTDAEYPEYRNIYSKVHFNDPEPDELPSDGGEVMAQKSSESAHDKGTYVPYLRSVTRARLYQDELRAIRRALANIPTYMICDDHEVTDDLFLDYNWCETVLSSALGNRIVQNGLTAFTLFQSWGNTPAQFEGPVGQRLLALMPRWVEPNNYDNSDNPAAPAGWPTMAACVGMPSLEQTVAQHRLVPLAADHLKHHFYIAWEKHEVLVLDTRTARDFPGSGSDFAALISRESLETQFESFATSSTIEVSFLVIATPISGIPHTEESLKHMARYGGMVKIGLSSTKPTVSERNYYTDGEGYGFQQKGLQDLYARICRCVAKRSPAGSAAPARIVVLSGDVHYGFTNRLEFWGDRFADMAETDSPNPTTTHFVLAQLCASALKNEKDAYIKIIRTSVGTFGYKSIDEQGYTKDELLEPPVWVGWVPPATDRRLVGSLYYAGTVPRQPTRKYWVSRLEPVLRIRARDLHNGQMSYSFPAAPDWMYRITYIKALRPPLTPSEYLAVSDPATSPAATPQQRLAALQAYTAASQNDRQYLLTDAAGSEAVGRNNFGEITFAWGTTEDTKFVRHNIWWSRPGPGGVDEKRQPHSMFSVLLGQDATQYPKPTAPYTT